MTVRIRSMHSAEVTHIRARAHAFISRCVTTTCAQATQSTTAKREKQIQTN